MQRVHIGLAEVEQRFLDPCGLFDFGLNLFGFCSGSGLLLGNDDGLFGSFGFSTKKENKSGSKKQPQAQKVGSEKKPPVVNKTEKKSENEQNGEKKRPFYLDAPRGKSKTKGKGKKR
jgi:hypothetical protein